MVLKHHMTQKLILWGFPISIVFAEPGFLVVFVLSISIALERV